MSRDPTSAAETGVNGRPPLLLTPEARDLWEVYAVAKQRADDTLLSEDGRVAAQAFYRFVEVFMPQVYGANVVPLAAQRSQR